MTPDLSHAFSLAAQEDAAARVFAYAVEGITSVAPSLLTTASIYDLASMRSRRVFTQDPEAYPTGNFKLIERNLYYERVLEGRQPFSSETIEEIAEVFFDWEKIRDLGFESNMNLPAVADGEVIGTVNLLNRAGHFTASRVAAAMEWQSVVTLAFLLLHRQDAEAATFHPAGETPAMVGGVEG